MYQSTTNSLYKWTKFVSHKITILPAFQWCTTCYCIFTTRKTWVFLEKLVRKTKMPISLKFCNFSKFNFWLTLQKFFGFPYSKDTVKCCKDVKIMVSLDTELVNFLDILGIKWHVHYFWVITKFNDISRFEFLTSFTKKAIHSYSCSNYTFICSVCL